jgi:hypothetical protein
MSNASLFSALSHPASYNHHVSPTIAEHPSASNGPYLGMPNSMGAPGGMITRDSRGSHYDSGGVQHTNGSDNRKYLQDCTIRQPGDTGQGQVAFEHVETPHDPIRCGNFMHQQAKTIYSWSTLHYMLKYSPTFRYKYGKEIDNGEDMKLHFPVLGVQIWSQDRLDASKGILDYTDAPNFCMSGRVNNVPNVWVLGKPTGTSVSELSVLMGMWRRHPYNGDEAMEDYVWAPQPSNSHIFDINRNINRRSHALDRVQAATSARTSQINSNLEFPSTHGLVGQDSMDTLFECMDEKKPADPNQNMSQAMDPLNFNEWQSNYRSSCYDLRTPESANQEWYWSLDPYVSDDRQPPPWALYNAPHYSGSYIIMGTVIHVTRGDNNATPATQARAARALYPKTRSRDYLIDLHLLDQLEVHWNVGKMLGA